MSLSLCVCLQTTTKRRNYQRLMPIGKGREREGEGDNEYTSTENTPGRDCSNRKGNESIELPFSALVELNPSFSCSRLLLVCLMSQRQKQQQQLSNYLSYQLRRRGRENRQIEAVATESSARILLLADFLAPSFTQHWKTTWATLKILLRLLLLLLKKDKTICFGYILSTL